MRLPIVPKGKSSAFYLYQHYYFLSEEEKVEFRPFLVAFEWGGLSRGNPGVALEDVEALVSENLAYATARASEWFVR